jgi:hypothetical protein
VVAKAKKAEKALANANKEHFQREQAVAEWLNAISTAAGGTYLSCSSFPAGVAFLFSMIISLFSHLFVPICYSERAKVSLSTPQPGDNPLLAAVNLLEASWISVQDIFELVDRVLSWMFVGLWPKKKAEVLVNDLKQLAKAFDTKDDPLLQLKGLSVK